MYILMESNTNKEEELKYEHSWDNMGHTDKEEKAMDWVQCNPKFRKYKYCPNKDITPNE